VVTVRCADGMPSVGCEADEAVAEAGRRCTMVGVASVVATMTKAMAQVS
jgi:hypothetical protein